jgi:hypothetical protein
MVHGQFGKVSHAGYFLAKTASCHSNLTWRKRAAAGSMPKTAEHLTPTRCADCPLRPLEVFRGRSPDDVNFLQDFKAGELVVSPGTSIIAQDAKSTHLFTVLSGWAFRYRTLEDGRRQIINYAVAR